jgi:hypothetical protein
MAKTRIELTYQVLRELGALPDGSDPPDEDKNRVDALIDPIVAMLREMDVYHLADVDAIPDAAFIPLSFAVAGYAASSFGQQNDQSLTARAQYGEQTLQTIQSENPHYTTLEIMAY